MAEATGFEIPVKYGVWYRGEWYFANPHAKNPYQRNYFVRGNKLLHRQIWQDVYGKIPEGMAVHHKNGYSLDNRIGNLELLTIAGHARRHRDERYAGTNCNRRRHRFQIFFLEEKRKYEHYCEACGGKFISHGAKGGHCSERCRKLSEWKEDKRAVTAGEPTGRYGVIAKQCCICGKGFITYRRTGGAETKTCGDLCRKRLKRRTEMAKAWGDRVCVYCGKIFKAYKRTTKFCSRNCRRRGKAGSYRNKDNEG